MHNCDALLRSCGKKYTECHIQPTIMPPTITLGATNDKGPNSQRGDKRFPVECPLKKKFIANFYLEGCKKNAEMVEAKYCVGTISLPGDHSQIAMITS